MTTPTETLIKALRILSNDIQSDDGVANAAILEAAQRMEEDQEVIFQAGESIKILRQTVQHRNETIDELKSDLLELKELNEHLRDNIKRLDGNSNVMEQERRWNQFTNDWWKQAKEAKP